MTIFSENIYCGFEGSLLPFRIFVVLHRAFGTVTVPLSAVDTSRSSWNCCHVTVAFCAILFIRILFPVSLFIS